MFHLIVVSLSFAQGEEGDQGSPGEVGSQGPMVRCCYLLHDIKVFQITDCSLLCQELFFSPPAHWGTCWICLLLQGPQGIRGATGMMGPKGEMVSAAMIFKPMVPSWFFLNYLQIQREMPIEMFILWTDYNTNINIVLLQGARGLDGDPGPQGVAGATVSSSHGTNASIFAANVVRMSNIWSNFFFFRGIEAREAWWASLGPGEKRSVDASTTRTF